MTISSNALFGHPARNLSLFLLLLAGIPARAQWMPLNTGSADAYFLVFDEAGDLAYRKNIGKSPGNPASPKG